MTYYPTEMNWAERKEDKVLLETCEKMLELHREGKPIPDELFDKLEIAHYLRVSHGFVIGYTNLEDL